MKLHATIDRLEGDKAVLLFGEQELTVNWPRALLPETATEGDALAIDIEVDKAAAEQTKGEVAGLMEKLLKGNRE